MLNATSAARVFVAMQPVDLRGGTGSFSPIVRATGSRFSSGRIRGCVCAKRLEKGRFSWPCVRDACATLRAAELIALLSGLEVRENPGWFRR